VDCDLGDRVGKQAFRLDRAAKHAPQRLVPVIAESGRAEDGPQAMRRGDDQSPSLSSTTKPRPAGLAGYLREAWLL
jgi:hypothetical protein